MRIIPAAALLTALVLSGCGPSPEQAKTFKDKMAQVETEIRSIKPTNGPVVLVNNGLRAEITEAGDLSIDGKPVALTAEQRAIAQRFHGAYKEVAAAGVGLGASGAAIAGQTVGSLMQGDLKQLKEGVAREAGAMREKSRLLCDHLGEALALQNALTQSVPAFAPYAKLGAVVTSDCVPKQNTASNP